MHEKLIQLGLTSSEAKIYVSLIDYGRLQAGMISRKTGIHRRSVYDSLERLIEKGLVSWIRENDKRYYFAENPEKLSEMVSIQKRLVDSILPELNIKFSEKKEKQETKFYRGTDGIKSILDDQLNDEKPVYIIGASYDTDKILKYYMLHYTSKRVNKKLKLYLIYAGDQVEFGIPYSKIAYLPKSYASPVSTNIYGDKVAIVVWSEEPVAILIKNKNVASTYKNYFDILWKIAKKKKERPVKYSKSFEV